MISASSLFLNPLVLWHKQFLGKIRNFVLTPCSQQCLLCSASLLHLHRDSLHKGRALSGNTAWVPAAEQGPAESSSFPTWASPQGWLTVPREQLRCSLFPLEHFKGHFLILGVPRFSVRALMEALSLLITGWSEFLLRKLPFTYQRTEILEIFVQPSYKGDASTSGGICISLNLNSCRRMRS